MRGMLRTLRAKSHLKRNVHLLYSQLVTQARQPVLYAPPYSIDDTIDGRFSLILLHLFIVDQWLMSADENTALRRNLQETMINDIDRSLRELGVGDMSVGKEMKKVGATLLGCMKSYREALLEDDRLGALSFAIQRNMTDDAAAAAALASYALEMLELLSEKTLPDDLEQVHIFKHADETAK